jgi:hypothetical protein
LDHTSKLSGQATASGEGLAKGRINLTEDLKGLGDRVEV